MGGRDLVYKHMGLVVGSGMTLLEKPYPYYNRSMIAEMAVKTQLYM